MIDPFGRTITYLRVSVTDRCDLRCVYCMSEDMSFLPKRELLTLEELDRLCAAFIRLGTTKIRITGGEPLVRRDVMSLFQRLGTRIGHGLNELTVTTNGTQLSKHAQTLYDYGVRRVNVSLDTREGRSWSARLPASTRSSARASRKPSNTGCSRRGCSRTRGDATATRSIRSRSRR